MTCPEFIRDALAQFAVCIDNGESISVPTQCLYPSNATATVYVTGGAASCAVSDEGRAIAEIAGHGFDVQNPENYLRQFCAPRGLRLSGPKIHSPPLPAEALPSAISLVATASVFAAYWAVRTFRPRSRGDLRRELRDLLGARFSRERVREEVHLNGHSGRNYRFDFLAEIGDLGI